MSMFLGSPEVPLGKSKQAKEDETALAQLVKRDKEEDKNDSILTSVITTIGKSLTHNLEEIRRSTESTSSRLGQNNSSGPTKWIVQISNWSSEKYTLDIIAEALGDILTSVENTEKNIETSAIARHSDSPLETLMKKQHDAQKNNMSVKPDKNSQIINNIKAGTEPIAAGLAVILEAVLGDPGVVLKNYKEGEEGKEKDKDKPKTTDNAIKRMGQSLTNLILGKSKKEIDAEKEVEDNKKDKDKAKNEKKQTGFLRKIWKNSKDEDRGWFAFIKKWFKLFLVGLAIWFTPLTWLKTFVEMPLWGKLLAATVGLAAILNPLGLILGGIGVATGLGTWAKNKWTNRNILKTPGVKPTGLNPDGTKTGKPTNKTPENKTPKAEKLSKVKGGSGTLGKLGKVGLIGTIISLLTGAARIAEASADEKSGKITKNEAIEEKGKAIGSTAGVLAGFSAGAVIGTAMLPGLGTTIGGLIGGTAGALGLEPIFEDLGGMVSGLFKDEEVSKKTPKAIELEMSKEYKKEEYKKEGWRKNVVMAKEEMESTGMGKHYTQEGFEREVREKKLDWLRDKRKAARLGDDVEIDGQNKAERLEAYRMLETKTMAETYDDSSMLTTNESQEKLLKKLVDNTEPEKTKKEKPSQWSPFGHDKSAFKKQTSLGDRFKNLGEWLWGDKKKEETNEGPVHSYNSDNTWTSPTMGDGMYDDYSGTIPEANQATFEPLFKEWQETVNQKIKVDESGGRNTPLYEQLNQKADDIKKQMRALELNTAQKASDSTSSSSSSSVSGTLKNYIASDEGWEKYVDFPDSADDIADAKEIAKLENKESDRNRQKAGEPLKYNLAAKLNNTSPKHRPMHDYGIKVTTGTNAMGPTARVESSESIGKKPGPEKAKKSAKAWVKKFRASDNKFGMMKMGLMNWNKHEIWNALNDKERDHYDRMGWKPEGAKSSPGYQRVRKYGQEIPKYDKEGMRLGQESPTAQSSTAQSSQFKKQTSLGDRFKNLGKWLWGDKKKSVAKKSSAIMDANKVTAAPVQTASTPMTMGEAYAQAVTKRSVNLNLKKMRKGPKTRMGERAYRRSMRISLDPQKSPNAKAFWDAMKPEEQKQWKDLDPYKLEKSRSTKFIGDMRTAMPGTSSSSYQMSPVSSSSSSLAAKLNNTASSKSQTINGIHDENASLKEEKMSGINQTNVIDSSSKSSVNNSSQSIVTQPTATQTTTAFSPDWENF